MGEGKRWEPSKMRQVAIVFLLILGCALALKKVNVQKTERATEESLKQKFAELCAAQCEIHVKNDEMCLTFCSFLDEVEKDLTKLAKMYNSFGRPEEALEWAMADAVNEKLLTHEEDDAAVALKFMKAVRQWGSYVEQIKMR